MAARAEMLFQKTTLSPWNIELSIEKPLQNANTIHHVMICDAS